MARTSRRSGLVLLIAGLALLAGGCSGDSSGPGASELLGLWGAVTYEYTSDANPSVTWDRIADAGSSYSIELIVGGTYRWTLSTVSGTTTGSGRFTVTDRRLTLTPADGGDPVVYELSFNEVFLTLRDDDASWDFDGDGTEEPARLVLVLDRF